MATQFKLGTRASCSDGTCGGISRIILDPSAMTVTHLVIQPAHHAAEGRLVPVDLVDTAADKVRLTCTMAEFERLEPAQEVELVDPYGGYPPAEAVQGYGDVGSFGVGGSVTGLGIGMSEVRGPRPLVRDSVPPGRTELAGRERVHATDGEIGQIDGFVVTRDDHRVTHVLLKEGHLWGRKEVAIPVSVVASVADGIRLNITKEQVGRLAPGE